MNIRAERQTDQAPIRHILRQTFATEAEANLVDSLRESRIPLISLVAEQKETIVGHNLFSPVTMGDAQTTQSIAGLAPIAVLPTWQHKGIGSKLMMAGLQECKKAGYHPVVVLGFPDFYTRFGFRSSVAFGIHSEYNVPAEVFMVKELTAGALQGVGGLIRYHQAFNNL